MINRRKEMKIQVRPDMKGGQGEVTVLHMVDCENLHNVRFIGEMTIPANASIGPHGHDNETEYYVILEGIGIVTEKDGDHRVGKGEIVVTGGGATHAIRNAGHTDLKVLAFIVVV